MKRRGLAAALCGVMLILLSCDGDTETSPASEVSQAPVAATGPELEVIFEGLIAFAPRKDAEGMPIIWALFPDASYKLTDSTTVESMKAELPPCATDKIKDLDELERLLKKSYPSHVPRMKVENAIVTRNGSPTSDLEFLVDNMEITVDTVVRLKSSLLDILASRRTLAKTLEGENGNEDNYKHLDQLDADLLLDDATITHGDRLAARVKIDFGDTIDDRPLKCPEPVLYGFESPAPGCKAEVPQILAESVIVTQKNFEQAELILNRKGDKIEIKPKKSGQTVTITFLNTDPSMEGHDTCASRPHLESYRWFYRLLKPAQLTSGCTDHYFPCEAGDQQGGTKCPQKEFPR